MENAELSKIYCLRRWLCCSIGIRNKLINPRKLNKFIDGIIDPYGSDEKTKNELQNPGQIPGQNYVSTTNCCGCGPLKNRDCELMCKNNAKLCHEKKNKSTEKIEDKYTNDIIKQIKELRELINSIKSSPIENNKLYDKLEKGELRKNIINNIEAPSSKIRFKNFHRLWGDRVNPKSEKISMKMEEINLDEIDELDDSNDEKFSSRHSDSSDSLIDVNVRKVDFIKPAEHNTSDNQIILYNPNKI
jgi:hypothetical protein